MSFAGRISIIDVRDHVPNGPATRCRSRSGPCPPKWARVSTPKALSNVFGILLPDHDADPVSSNSLLERAASHQG